MTDWRSRIVGEGEEQAEQLLAHPNNPRVHPLAQQEALAEVLDTVGWVARVIVNKRTGHVLDGHLRVSLAISRGEKVPVTYVDVEPEEEALILSTLDPLAALAGTDQEILDRLHAEVAESFEGFQAEALRELVRMGAADPKTGVLPPEGESDAEPAEVGQTWRVIGPEGIEHLLVVADSTSPGALEGALDGIGSIAPAFLLTDPPYSSGGLHAGDRRADVRKKYGHQKSAKTQSYTEFSGDSRDQRSWQTWTAAWLGACLRVVEPGGYLACFVDWRQLPALSDTVQWAGWTWRGVNVWDKGAGARVPHLAYYRTQAEFVVWGTGGKLEPSYEKGRGAIPGVFTWPVDSDKTHLTQKPVEVLRWLLEILAAPSLVLDPFVGSGSTILAADLEGHRCVGFEFHAGIAGEALARMRAAGFVTELTR